jgi:uncharacterized membrane protein
MGSPRLAALNVLMTTHGVLFWLTLLGCVGCGLVGGVFFAFSTFVMASLTRLPSAQGIAAMQSINVVVLRPAFMIAMFGTAAACVALAVWSITRWHQPDAAYSLAASVLYLVGSVVVTAVFHEPRNKALNRMPPDTAEAAVRWRTYASAWTAGNHVRTLTCLSASALFAIALAV